MAAPSTPQNDALRELGRLLATAGARPTINRSRVAPSTLHDATYHVAVIACALRSHGASAGSVKRRILAAWLKLLQFVAARPSLVENLREYVRTRRDGDLENWSLMPRGYLGDRTHDGVVDLLVAAGILRRDGDFLEASTRFDTLDSIGQRIEVDGLFSGERAILEKLKEVRVTKALLGGT